MPLHTPTVATEGPLFSIKGSYAKRDTLTCAPCNYVVMRSMDFTCLNQRLEQVTVGVTAYSAKDCQESQVQEFTVLAIIHVILPFKYGGVSQR